MECAQPGSKLCLSWCYYHEIPERYRTLPVCTNAHAFLETESRRIELQQTRLSYRGFSWGRWKILPIHPACNIQQITLPDVSTLHIVNGGYSGCENICTLSFTERTHPKGLSLRPQRSPERGCFCALGVPTFAVLVFRRLENRPSFLILCCFWGCYSSQRERGLYRVVLIGHKIK